MIFMLFLIDDFDVIKCDLITYQFLSSDLRSAITSHARTTPLRSIYLPWQIQSHSSTEGVVTRRVEVKPS
jgi:hypothetical protein